MSAALPGATALFRVARDRMVAGEASFEWPRHTVFNWAVDWFDQIAPAGRCALVVVGERTQRSVTYGELRKASNRAANWLRARGIAPGDRVLALMRNSVEYYAVALALMKLGSVLVPSFTSVPRAELSERLHRARIRHLVADLELAPDLCGLPVPGMRIAAEASARNAPPGWLALAEASDCSDSLSEPWQGAPEHPLMGLFTSGTTSRPKLALHSHQSYPVGHLSSLCWNGIGPSDIHANVSQPGWAKHAWSSFFVPFSAEATVLVFEQGWPSTHECLAALDLHEVTSLCAPPSYWRTLVREGLGQKPRALAKVVSAGEALDENLVEEVQRRWQLPLRNGYGQTEATAMIGFTLGERTRLGALGRPLPGYEAIRLVDPQTGEEADQGEICVDLEKRPLGLMLGYADETGHPQMPAGRYYRTGDIAQRDADGCLHLLGRTNDVFKSYDVRISPIEVERRFREHPLVGDIAVFAALDKFGEPTPAAAVVAAEPRNAETLVASLLEWQSTHIASAQRLRKVWLVEQLPRTLSGKINRTELRARFATIAP